MKTLFLTKTVLALVVLVWSLFSCILSAELKLASPFTDHMVLQRNTPIAVWGKAKANARVVVSFAGKTTSVIADKKRVARFVCRQRADATCKHAQNQAHQLNSHRKTYRP